MKESFQRPDLMHFFQLICYYANSEPDINTIQSLFEEMASYELTPDKVRYSCIFLF
jgi:hypothetical protein